MYSRAERKDPTLNPRTNPNLGPGCYEPESSFALPMKDYAEQGYAPFSSIACRRSIFDDLVSYNPGPTEYDPNISIKLIKSQINTKTPAIFSKTKDERFKDIEEKTPGPAYYNVTDVKGETIASSHPPRRVFGRISQDTVETQDQKPAPTAPRHQEELRQSDINKNMLKDDSIVITQPRSTTIYTPPKPRPKSSIMKKIIEKKKEQIPPEKKENSESKQESPEDLDNIIIWKRKFIPPSIPAGRWTYGYDEGLDGDVVPRRPPKLDRTIGPAFYQVSKGFTDQSLEADKGYDFGRPRCVRLEKKEPKIPGPASYNLENGEKVLKTRVKGGTFITRAKYQRFSEFLASKEKRKHVPGPGAYEVKLTSHAPRACLKFYGKEERFIETGTKPFGIMQKVQNKNPGPGAYNVGNSKKSAFTPNNEIAFGSNTSRFHISHERKPGPDRYNRDEVISLVKNVKVRAQISKQSIGFGAKSGRFVFGKDKRVPGPGAYEISSAFLHSGQEEKPKSRGLAKGKLLSGGINPNEAPPESLVPSPDKNIREKLLTKIEEVEGPGFGVQSARFQQMVKNRDVPPVGAYRTGEAFDHLHSKKANAYKSLLSSRIERTLFKVNDVPGPGSYDPKASKNTDLRVQDGTGLFSEQRFRTRNENIPGPGSYNTIEMSSLTKKTFNSTLGYAPN